jgi:hypothetical protein
MRQKYTYILLINGMVNHLSIIYMNKFSNMGASSARRSADEIVCPCTCTWRYY